MHYAYDNLKRFITRVDGEESPVSMISLAEDYKAGREKSSRLAILDISLMMSM